MSKKTEQPTVNVTFRVPTQVASRLEEAGADFGWSRHEYARDLLLKALSGPSLHDVVAGIHQIQEVTKGLARQASAHGASQGGPPSRDSDFDEIAAKLDRLDAAITQFAKSHANGVTALLVEAGKLNLDDAKKWVARYVKTPPPNPS